MQPYKNNRYSLKSLDTINKHSAKSDLTWVPMGNQRGGEQNLFVHLI